MKRLTRVPMIALALSLLFTACADLVVPPQEVQVEIRPETPLDVLLKHLPLILIVALLIVTALLVRHFTRKGKK